MDLHERLLNASTAVIVVLIVVILAALPYLPDRTALIPAGAGMLLFAVIQRIALRFPRPELWVFGALLGAATMIVVAVAINGGTLTPALALTCWPVAGLAGRFPNRAAWLGTGYVAALVAVAVFIADPGVLTRDPLALALVLVAIVSINTAVTVLRESDVEHRGAAVLDPLTGMLNRAALTNRTREIEHQSRVTGEPVAVLVADLDQFKLVNDAHGHATGDSVLREVAYRMRKELRAYDLAYRIGGEEFVVLLLGGTLTAAAETAEELRAAIGTIPIEGLAITASVGVAASPAGVPFVWDNVFARADASLYLAKAEGRNRVFTEPAMPVA